MAQKRKRTFKRRTRKGTRKMVRRMSRKSFRSHPIRARRLKAVYSVKKAMGAASRYKSIKRSHEVVPYNIDRDHVIMRHLLTAETKFSAGRLQVQQLYMSRYGPGNNAVATNNWTPDSFFTRGGFSASTDVAKTDAPGCFQLGQKYKFGYISSVHYRVVVTREDSDNSEWEVGLTPISEDQFDEFAGSFPYGTPPGSTDEAQYQTLCQQSTTVRKKCLPTEGGKNSVVLEVHAPSKKFMRAGYPNASGTFWTGMSDGSLSSWTQPGIDSFMNLWCYSTDSDVTPVSFKFTIEYTAYVTAFQPRLMAAVP